MKCVSIVKRLAVATVAAAALAGPVTAAHALQFSQGDAILAVYGNGTEYVQNLGSYSTLLSNGLTLNLSGILGQVTPGGNPLQIALFGSSGNEIFFGDKFALSSWTNSNKNQVVPNALLGNLSGWATSLLTANDARNFFPQSDPLSFTTTQNNSGNNTLGGTTPAPRPAFAGVGDTLYLMKRPGAASTLAQVGTAVFNVDGQLIIGQVSAVPVPAAVVLFASGLVGLVGLARRRMSGTSQHAA